MLPNRSKIESWSLFFGTTVIATATDWQNYFALRHHQAAEIHIDKLAEEMLLAYNNSNPQKLNYGEWHIPFGDNINEEKVAKNLSSENTTAWTKEWLNEQKIKIATARCARVSYQNFEGKDDYVADVQLFDNLKRMGHMSPFEHCAKVLRPEEYQRELSGNFSGMWLQLRKTFLNENKKDPRVKKGATI